MHMCNLRHTDTKFAKQIAISQGYLSKLKDKIIQKMRDAEKKLRDAQYGPEDWAWIDPTKFFGEDNDDLSVGDQDCRRGICGVRDNAERRRLSADERHAALCRQRP